MENNNLEDINWEGVTSLTFTEERIEFLTDLIDEAEPR